mgnify:CR=1 FL=1
MIKMERILNVKRCASVWSVACGRFLSLGKDEGGAALVTTLAMFMFIYLVCTGVFTVSTAVRERIHLQNAADAAAYSAAVVQADTLSRIATINRAMAWTYVQMTRRQMDYVVLRWLQHTVDHYMTDKNEADSYNKGGILGSPCGGHGCESVGNWFIGANTSASSMNKVQLNGWNPSNYLGVDLSLPIFSEVSGLFGVGSTPRITAVQAALNSYAATSAYKAIAGSSGDSIVSQGVGSLSAMADLARNVSSDEPISNLETADSVREMMAGVHGAVPGKYEGDGTAIERLLQTQIVLDRLNIALMNICERRLAVEMPKKIATVVNNIVKANVPEYMADDCFYYLEQNENPIVDEVISDRNGIITSGYFDNLYNNPTDEKRFLRFAGYERSLIEEFMLGGGSENLSVLDKAEQTMLSRVAAGLDQWFVRGNGAGRTEDPDRTTWTGRGLQRCYKHWAEGPFANIHASHNPLPPSCWNTDSGYLHNSPASIALYSEWVWWSDVWSCPEINLGLFKIRLHIHLCPHRSKVWPWKTECEHNSKPGMFGTTELSETVESIGDLAGAVDDLGELAKGILEGRQKESEDREAPVELTEEEIAELEQKYANYNVGSVGAGDISKYSSSGINGFEDGCLMVPFIGTGSAAGHFAGYGRLYADAPQIYNTCYVGERAKPLILRANYFGKAGTITVGIARRNVNVWKRLLGVVEGLFSAFDPDVAWTWAFASAKAGHMNKGDSPSDRDYLVHWEGGNQEWNLCQSDWDAVFVPVRHAHSRGALVGSWIDSGSGYSKWIGDEGGWKSIDGASDKTVDSNWGDVQAPRGMLTVGGARGKLDWEALGDVTYH